MIKNINLIKSTVLINILSDEDILHVSAKPTCLQAAP